MAAALTALVDRLARATPLSAEDRNAIEALPATVRTLEPNASLLYPGDHSQTCCIVLSGWVGSFKLLGNGQRQVLAFYVAGDLPDLQSLYLPTTDYGICALTDASVALVPHGPMRALMVRRPDVAAALLRETLVSGSITREWVVGLGRRAGPQRMAHLFCELYTQQRAAGLVDTEGRCPLPISQTVLADALGLTAVHVNRILKELRGQGLIQLRQRTLVILDWPRLSALAEFDPTYLHLDRQGP